MRGISRVRLLNAPEFLIRAEIKNQAGSELKIQILSSSSRDITLAVEAAAQRVTEESLFSTNAPLQTLAASTEMGDLNIDDDFDPYVPSPQQQAATLATETSTVAAIGALHEQLSTPQSWLGQLVENSTANTYLVAGAVVGCALFMLLIGTVVCCWWYYCGGRRRHDSDRGSYQVERAIASDSAHQKHRTDEDLDLRYREPDARVTSGRPGAGSGAVKPNGILKKPQVGLPSSSASKPFIKNGARPSLKEDPRTPLASAGTEWYV